MRQRPLCRQLEVISSVVYAPYGTKEGHSTQNVIVLTSIFICKLQIGVSLNFFSSLNKYGTCTASSCQL